MLGHMNLTNELNKSLAYVFMYFFFLALAGTWLRLFT